MQAHLSTTALRHSPSLKPGLHRPTSLSASGLQIASRTEPQSHPRTRTGRDLSSLPILNTGPETFVARSEGMTRLLRIAANVADASHPVLLLGEAGAGKEAIARLLHRQSRNGAKPFTAVDCSAEPAVVEAQMFGAEIDSERGAEEAGDDRGGLLYSAHGGTVLLKQIGGLSRELQARLLRALEGKEARASGEERSRSISVRVMAASRQDLSPALEQGRFRRDLYFRLNVVSLRISPLRDRQEDLALLVRHFLLRRGSFLTLSAEALEDLRGYIWPGNLSELEEVISRICATASGPVIEKGDLPAEVRNFAESRSVAEPEAESVPARRLQNLPHLVAVEEVKVREVPSILPIAEIEKQAILRTVRQLNGDKLLAAKLLGIGKTTLYRKLKGYGVSVGEWSEEAHGC